MVDINEISKKDFEAYENVRVSGKINMFDRVNGCILSGLDKDMYTSIMKNYKQLIEKYADGSK